MRIFKFLSFLLLLSSSFLKADQKITIETNPKPKEQLHVERKSFCSTVSEQDAKKKCSAWLEAQKKSLKNRLLLHNCSTEFLYGKEKKGCMAYLAEGEVKFLLNAK